MPMPTTYTTGTASVANGATTVTLVGAVSGAIYAGDLFCDPAQPLVPPQRIATDPVAGVFELAVAWPGTSLTSDPYEVRITPDSVRMQERTRQVLNLLDQAAVPQGGDPGQVLAKVSGDDYDVTWVNPVASAADVSFAPAGSIAASTVQAAIEELDTEKQPKDDDLTALASAFTRATSAAPAQLDLAEDTDNGTNKVSLKAPTSIASDRVQTLQDAAGTIALVADIAAAAGFRNRLINGNGAINQRVATSQADDTYAWDRHYVLTQTAAIGTTTISDVADGLPSMMRLTQSQVTAQRMGVAQIIESVNCKDLRGQAVTLLGKLRCSAAQAIRYTILEWTGTADAPVSDVVNSWTNGTFTAGQFFNSTTLTVTQVGTITPSAATVTDFLLNTTLASSVNNVIVLIWTEGTAAQNVTLDVAWGFVKGDQTGQTYPVEVRDRGSEQILCERYFQKSYAAGTAPGANVASGNCSITMSGPTGSQGNSLPLRNPMRGSPTQTIYDGAGNAGKVSYYNGTWNANGTISSQAGSNANWVYVQANIASTTQINYDYTKEAEL